MRTSQLRLKPITRGDSAKHRHVPVLMYHALDESRSVISISPAVFARQMLWLHENGYDVIPLSKLVEHVRWGEALPARAIVITFDDGFESVYTEAFPILAHYGFPATVFLVAGYCGQRNDWPNQPATIPRLPLLTWTQIREMDRQGIEFGAHTVTHPWLDRLSPVEIEGEIITSKTNIETQLGHPINLFAYPYGRYNDTVRAIVDRTFTGACSTYLGLVRAESDPLALERIETLYFLHPLLFSRLWSPFLPIYLNLRRLLRQVTSMVLGRPWR